MKKIFFYCFYLLLIKAAAAQTSISLSTGQTANGVCQKTGATDANWKVTGPGLNNIAPYVVPNYTLGNTVYWQPTPLKDTCKGCAQWINPTAKVGAQAPGNYVYERTFTVSPGNKQVDFNFQVAYDDDLAKLEIFAPGAATGDDITALVVRSAVPTIYYLSKPVVKSYRCPAVTVTGTWRIRANVKYYDALGGFLLKGCANVIAGSCCDCPNPDAGVNLGICQSNNGTITATASAVAASAGLGNGWTLKEVTCNTGKPCSWVPGPIKWQTTGSNIAIPNGVLVAGKCYVLTHYVNKCAAKWDPKQCLVYKAYCFSVCSPGFGASSANANLKIANLQENADRAESEAIEISENQ